MSKTNKRIRAKLCADLYVDMQALMPARETYLVGPDGVHPSEEGYEELAIRLGKVFFIPSVTLEKGGGAPAIAVAACVLH